MATPPMVAPNFVAAAAKRVNDFNTASLYIRDQPATDVQTSGAEKPGETDVAFLTRPRTTQVIVQSSAVTLLAFRRMTKEIV